MAGWDGPPEPVIPEDGDVPEVLIPDPGNPPVDPPSKRRVKLGTWKCECGNTVSVGVVDGEIQEPYECPESDGGCGTQGPFTHAGGLSSDQRQAALRAGDMWHPPTDADEAGFEELWADVRAYLRDHWDASEPEVYEGLTAYALSTWLRENLTFVPHLMLMGKTTGGKTRLLNTLSRVSYRAHVTASATPAAMFRLIDAYDVSYFVSEYHGLPYETQREIDAVVRAGQKRGEHVDRAEQTATGYEPDTFDPFAHIAIATQFTPDDDIINRCIQVRSSPADGDMPATLDEERAGGLRDRLLDARYRLLNSDEWAEAEREAYAYLEERGIAGRTREKLLSLLTVAIVWDHLDADMVAFVDEVVKQDREAAADSEDALVVEAIRDLAFEEVGETTVLGDGDPFGAVDIPLSAIAERYEAKTDIEKSAAWVGHVRSRLGLDKARKRDGTVISDEDLRPKLRQLCEEHNLGWEALDTHADAEPLPEDEKGKAAGGCSLCGSDRFLTHRDLDSNGRICEECAEELEGAT